MRSRLGGLRNSGLRTRCADHSVGAPAYAVGFNATRPQFAAWAWTNWEGYFNTEHKRDRPLDGLRIGREASDVEAAMRAYGSEANFLHHLSAYVAQVEHELYDERTDKQLPPYEFVVSTKQRRTALFVERLDHWLMAMHSCTRELPLGHPSWRVFVKSRRDGYLGQFRRCQDCKRWFQGHTEVHKLGHAVG